MPKIEESVVIARTREDIRDFMRNPENQPRWQSNLSDFTKLDEGDPEVGTRYRGVVRIAGKRVEWTAEIVEWDELAYYQLRSTESPIAFDMRYGFEEVAEGTRVTIDYETAPFGGFFGKLADPLVTRMYSRDVRGNLEALKDILEARP